MFAASLKYGSFSPFLNFINSSAEWLDRRTHYALTPCCSQITVVMQGYYEA